MIQALSIAFKASDQEKMLRNQLKELKRELAGISAVDEFARYARIQRKMIKMEEEAQNLGQSRMDSRESIRWKWSKIIQVINVVSSYKQLYCELSLDNVFLHFQGAVLLYLAITSRSEPVLLGLPSSWFWPINNLLSYPTGIEGALSTVLWLLICNNASRVLVK